MNPILQKLHDIEGLDPIGMWPLAIGWVVVIGISCLLTILLIWFVIAFVRFQRSWKSDTLKKLALLEENLTDDSAREALIMLSEYIKRIVLKRFSRKECAALTGHKWLKWLSEHDPKQFDWEKKGVLLIDAPYAPLNSSLSAQEVREMIQAAKRWVK